MGKIAKLLALGFKEDEIARMLGDISSVEKSASDLSGSDQPEFQITIPQQTGKCEFVHLHLHTDYSVLDGMCRIDNLVSRAVELGMPAIAITDHGAMSGAIEFYQAARQAGIKPILGCEVYYVPDMTAKDNRDMWHLVLLAKDVAGYRNLMKITSAGYLEGFHGKPRVDLDYISQRSEGLVAMTACIKGYVPAMILDGKMDEARAELGRLKDVFAEDLYIELQNHGLSEQKIVNPELEQLGRDMEIPIVATNDCHYVNSDDYTAHDVLLCIQTGKKLADVNRLRFGSDQYYFKTAEEMAQLFPPECLTRTLEVADKCSLELDLSGKMPQFNTPDGSTPEEHLWRRIQEGIRERYGGELDSARQERLQHEYDVIKKTGFAGYFLIIDDMVQYAHRHGIRVGAGRGSAVSSLVCYTLGITDVDPVKHDLLFERFLTEDRVSPPDVDLDFQHDRRSEVVEYIHRKYGYTAQIITFSRLSPRSLVRDVGRVLDVSQPEINRAAERIPNHTNKTLTELGSEIAELADIDERVIDIGTRLHGIIRHSGRHPGGVVVSDKSLTDTIPLCISKGAQLTQFDKDSLEACGMLKIDVLGIEALTVIDIAVDLVRERHGTDLTDIPMDDAKAYEPIASGDVSGIFQLGERWGGELARWMQPRKFEDIVHILALGRPGVLDAGLDDMYFENRSAGSIEYLHHSLKPILSDTFGVILFQEQIMQIAVDIAGFSWGDADRLRKAIGKKDVELMASMGSQFVDGCVERGLPSVTAEKLWEQIKFFGGYGFNRAHAVGYGTLTCQTAYLKARYTLEYLASLLSVKGSDEDDRKQYIADVRRRGIQILPPDVNTSTDVCRIVDDAIMLPLTAVSGLAEKGYAAIVEERQNGEFESYDNFCERVEKRAVNKRVRENLVKAGAFDALENRSELLMDLLEIPEPDLPALEREVLGFYVSGHPLDSFPYDDGTIHIGEVAGLPIGSEFKTVGIVTKVKNHTDNSGGSMAFVTLEDRMDRIEVTILASVYGSDLSVGTPLHLAGELNERGFKANDYEILELAAPVAT